MKQTNNAIKFLMAQYRAIFKNANLKMFLAAATAAAAMAAGSAQAANLEQAGWADLSGDKTVKTSGDFDAIALTANADTPHENTNKFTLTIEDGATHAITGNTGNKGGFTAKSGSLVIAGKAGVDATKLEIGKTSGAAVTLDTVEVSKGTLALTAGSLSANSITLGDTSKLTMADGTVSAAQIDLNKGAIVDITKGSLGATGNIINVETGATVTSKAASDKDAKITGILNIKGGTVDAATKTLYVVGSVNAEAGKLSVGQGGTANVSGLAKFTGEKSYVNSGTVVLAGDSVFVEKSVDTAATGGTLKIGGTSTMNKETLVGLLAGTEVGANGTSNAVIDLSSEAKIDLAGKAAQNAIIDDTNGNVNTKLKKNGGSITIKGKEASFGAFNVMSGDVGFDFETMTLGSGDKLDIQGGLKLTVGKTLTIGSGKEAGALTVTSGTITLDGASGDVAAKSVELKGQAAANATLTVESGEWTINDLTLTSGSANVKTDAGLTVGGTLSVKTGSTLSLSGGHVSALGAGKIDFSTADQDGVAITTGGSLLLDGDDIIKDKVVDASKVKVAAISGDGSAVVEIKESTEWTKEEFKKFKESFTRYNGVFQMDNINVAVSGDEVKLIDVVDGLKTNAYDEKTLVVESSDSISKTYSVGNVHVNAEQNLGLADNGSLILNKADADGHFIAKKSGEALVVAGVDFKGTTPNSNNLTLVGTGDIGAITATSTSKGKLVVGLADETPVAGHVTVVGGGIGATGAVLGEVALNDGSSLTVKSGDVFADNLALGAGTSLDVTGNVTVDTAAVKGADINVKNFSIKQTTPSFANDAVFSIDAGTMRVTDKLALGQNNLVTVGTAATFDAEGVETAPGSSAQVFAGTLELKTGTVLFVDPGFKSLPSFVVGQTITDGTTAGNLAGSIAIGANSAVGFGFTETEFNDVMSKHLVDGKFVAKDGYANAVVIGTPISLQASQYINVDKTLTSASGSANSVHLGEGAALVVTKDALSATNGAINFAGNNGSVNADSGSTVVLEGGVTLADTDLKLFSGATTINSNATIAAAGGLIKGSLDSTGKLALEADNQKLGAIRSVVSSPIVDLLVDYRDGDFHGASDAGLDFIESMLNKDNFVAIDAAAHAATYAGAQQAAVAAVGTMAEAVGGRVGSMGVEAATIAATGSQVTGGVWLSPMYKSVDADGFNAQGASYGSDIDLAGVAFGADTVDGNTRYGVVFNIGSGEAEGKGNGNGLKDDFDYYGIGLYSVRASNNFAVVADASYNVISHDVEGLGAKGSAETVALTAGLTGQYTMSSPMVDVTPHLGARFIRLDTDSYDLVAGGDVVAETDFDVQNVFSVPLGVTLSKAFEMGGWSLAPSADLSITFNTGDTDVESNTYFTGTKSYGFTTEVLDEVTYGIAVGLGAQYGAFGTNIGLNYTGSENTDSFGVNAQARYMF